MRVCVCVCLCVCVFVRLCDSQCLIRWVTLLMYCGMCCPCRCWFSNLTYFYTSLIAPLCIMLLFNLVTVFIVTRSLHSKLSVSPDYSMVKLVRIIASLSLLVGATWSIGALLSFVDSVILQYAFAILNSLQGFLIFFVNILTSNEIRARIETSVKSSLQPSGFSTAATSTASVSGAVISPRPAAKTPEIITSQSRHSRDFKDKVLAIFSCVCSRTRKYSPEKAATLSAVGSYQSNSLEDVEMTAIRYPEEGETDLLNPKCKVEV